PASQKHPTPPAVLAHQPSGLGFALKKEAPNLLWDAAMQGMLGPYLNGSKHAINPWDSGFPPTNAVVNSNHAAVMQLAITQAGFHWLQAIPCAALPHHAKPTK